MSHAATNWAIRQRGLKPATKIVLWHLADCHNGHTGQCNPKQSTLADMCEMSRSTLNLHLEKLEVLGLIRRVTSVDETTKRQRPTHYVLALDDAESAVSENKTRAQDAVQPSLDIAEPRPEYGHGAVSENRQNPCPNLDDYRVRKSDTKNPVKEPRKGTGKKERDDARILEILSTVVSTDVAVGFIELRNKKRAFITEHAADLMVKDLTGHPNPDAVVEASIKAGWTGLFPDKIGGPREQFAPDRRTAAADHAFAERTAFAATNRSPTRSDFGFGGNHS